MQKDPKISSEKTEWAAKIAKSFMNALNQSLYPS
jgi:hypothetical protein